MDKLEKPISVVMLTTSFPLFGNKTSGPFVLRLIENLPPNVKVEVLTPCVEKSIEGLESVSYRVRCFRYAPWRLQTLAHRPGGIPVAVRRRKIAWLLLPSLFLSMFWYCLCASRRAQLIHANWSVNGFVAGFAGLFTRTPVLTTLRGDDVNKSEKSSVFRFILRGCLLFCDRVVVVGENVGIRAASILKLPRSYFEVVPNGVSKEYLEIPLPHPGRVLHLVTIGSLIPRKGVDTIIRALALLPKEVEFVFTVVGDGPERRSLELLVKENGLSDNVVFSGSLEPEAVPSILALNQVFIFASRAEGRSNSLIEALAAGRAVIASRIPENEELVDNEKNGFLFDNAEELKGLLLRLSSHPEMIRLLGQKGRDSILAKNLAWESTCRRYAEIYADMIANRNR
ncbi:MAG: glycosyltransferase family 4 protein [Candidatus Thiodiazotropha sp. (ex Epidulcina cf. delphinae)]|nr:glycosyltransferase family 4 protein [Candidatus Thiodiazotropha sp. (ex Epidulcina cf. delphinae)]